MTNFYMLVYLVCFFAALCNFLDNINGLSPLLDFLHITKQVLMLLLNFLYVIYLQVCSFHFLHTALQYSCTLSVWQPITVASVLSRQGSLVTYQTDDRNTVTPNAFYNTIYPPYGFLTIKLST